MSEYWGDLNIYFGTETREEAEELFDELMNAASDLICGPDVGPDHECALDWTAGGSIRSDEAEERRWRLEDAAPAMYAALKTIVDIAENSSDHARDLFDIEEVARRTILAADSGTELPQTTKHRRVP